METTFDYRIVRQLRPSPAASLRGVANADPEPEYAVHEVNYDDGRISSWSERPMTVVADDLDSIRWELETMLRALAQPVLEVRDGQLVEVEPAAG